MAAKDDKQASKFMSLVLRHAPPDIGIRPDAQGWVLLDDLIHASDGLLDHDTIERIVKTSDKQRFRLSRNGHSIRANQGHSFPVDLGLTPQAPPSVLFHGTAQSTLAKIMKDGLKPMSRQHVHLSPDKETAHKVGMRHGTPVILEVSAGAMHKQGHMFFLSENGVWLTNHVSPTFLTLTP